LYQVLSNFVECVVVVKEFVNEVVGSVVDAVELSAVLLWCDVAAFEGFSPFQFVRCVLLMLTYVHHQPQSNFGHDCWKAYEHC